MERWKIEFCNVGDHRAVGAVVVDADGLVKAKQRAMQLCRRHLSTRGDIYLEARGNYTYCIILSGLHEVGEIKLTRLAMAPRDAPQSLGGTRESARGA
jgi:hypothetical protein